MVMMARMIWRLENKRRHRCETCGYSTHNKSHMRRHLESKSHFLMHDFGLFAPRDICLVVASFLDFRDIYKLGQLAADALNYRRPDGCVWRFTRVEGPGGPLSRIYVSGVPRARRRRTRVYG